MQYSGRNIAEGLTKRKTEGREGVDLREYNPWLKCIADGLAE